MVKSKFESKLFAFLFFPKYEEAIHVLICMAQNEPWDFPSVPLEARKNAILKNYLEFTFRRLLSEKKLEFTPDLEFVSFNTGLLSRNMEDIYAIGFKNKRNPGPGVSPYVFLRFCLKSDNFLLEHFSSHLPSPANYFTNPSEFVFDPTCEIICQYEHIIDDNRDRFPAFFADMDTQEIAVYLRSAVEEAKLAARTNFTLAVPHFYDEQVQLMIPLRLSRKSKGPDLALVLTRIGQDKYTARTVLTLQMAYNDARVIIRPQVSWLYIDR